MIVDTRVVILMGASGSGKSTHARELCRAHREEVGSLRSHCVVCSADSFPGLYETSGRIRPEQIGDAHAWCLQDFTETVRSKSHQRRLVVVDNTNTTIAELAPYVAVARAYGIEPEILRVRSRYGAERLSQRSVHCVPVEAVAVQLERIERTLLDWPNFWPSPQQVTL